MQNYKSKLSHSKSTLNFDKKSVNDNGLKIYYSLRDIEDTYKKILILHSKDVEIKQKYSNFLKIIYGITEFNKNSQNYDFKNSLELKNLEKSMA